MRLSHGQAPRASKLEYSVREKTTDLFCDEAESFGMQGKHGVRTAIQESKKVAHKRGAWPGYVCILSSHEQRQHDTRTSATVSVTLFHHFRHASIQLSQHFFLLGNRKTVLVVNNVSAHTHQPFSTVANGKET